MKIEDIKNDLFRKNVIDIDNNMIVKSIFLKNNEENNKSRRTTLWKYYRDRSKRNVNEIIDKYGRDILVINYSIETHKKENHSSG